MEELKAFKVWYRGPGMVSTAYKATRWRYAGHAFDSRQVHLTPHNYLTARRRLVMNNPKLVGSNLIDCIPQTGECPIGCAECFYNGGRFYRTLDEPLIPTWEESRDKIVRMNSGHDSNIEHDHVIATAHLYRHSFFNTSIPQFDFPGPVVFTCNGKRPLFVDCPENVMFVRVRINSWDLVEQDELVEHYLAQGVPVVLTFTRYYSQEAVKKPNDYSWRMSISNKYWRPTLGTLLSILARYRGMGVRMCGSPISSLCVDCRNCELLYWDALRRMGYWDALIRVG